MLSYLVGTASIGQPSILKVLGSGDSVELVEKTGKLSLAAKSTKSEWPCSICEIKPPKRLSRHMAKNTKDAIIVFVCLIVVTALFPPAMFGGERGGLEIRV
ncbi:hypothetical protein FHT77_004525 [Rhizobium sp. BK181]|uniref:hypothetical protein n=1 Tax=Rhizobium sp. BK181 TaxID=2587072 RepID=UPI00161374FA|nr:hypothetical protein [Rhizobium sp. BK181]MBB3318624.1 hypothetical protein [Rhizobium sp. BK181]